MRSLPDWRASLGRLLVWCLALAFFPGALAAEEVSWVAAVVTPRCGVDEGKPPSVCGGALIDDEWILTAAHCVGSVLKLANSGEQRYRSLRAWKRRAWLEVGEDRIGSESLKIQWVCRHPDYVDPENRNDLALIRLTSTGDGPIELGAPGDGEPLTMIGWGTRCFVHPDGPSRRLDLELQTSTACLAQKDSLTDLCTGPGPAHGDSGSALIAGGAGGASGPPVVIGVAKKSCLNDVAIFEAVAAHRGWIEDVTGLSWWQRRFFHRNYCSDFGLPIAAEDEIPVPICTARSSNRPAGNR